MSVQSLPLNQEISSDVEALTVKFHWKNDCSGYKTLRKDRTISQDHTELTPVFEIATSRKENSFSKDFLWDSICLQQLQKMSWSGLNNM